MIHNRPTLHLKGQRPRDLIIPKDRRYDRPLTPRREQRLAAGLKIDENYSARAERASTGCCNSCTIKPFGVSCKRPTCMCHTSN